MSNRIRFADLHQTISTSDGSRLTRNQESPYGEYRHVPNFVSPERLPSQPHPHYGGGFGNLAFSFAKLLEAVVDSKDQNESQLPLILRRAAAKGVDGLVSAWNHQPVHPLLHPKAPELTNRGFESARTFGPLDVSLLFELGRQLLRQDAGKRDRCIMDLLWAKLSAQMPEFAAKLRQNSDEKISRMRFSEDLWLLCCSAISAALLVKPAPPRASAGVWDLQENLHKVRSWTPAEPFKSQLENVKKRLLAASERELQSGWRSHARNAALIQLSSHLESAGSEVKPETLQDYETEMLLCVLDSLLFQTENILESGKPFLTPSHITAGLKESLLSPDPPDLIRWLRDSFCVSEVTLRSRIDDEQLLPMLNKLVSNPDWAKYPVDGSTDAIEITINQRTHVVTPDKEYSRLFRWVYQQEDWKVHMAKWHILNRLLVECLAGNTFLPEQQFFRTLADEQAELHPLGIWLYAMHEIFDVLHLSWNDDSAPHAPGPANQALGLVSYSIFITKIRGQELHVDMTGLASSPSTVEFHLSFNETDQSGSHGNNLPVVSIFLAAVLNSDAVEFHGKVNFNEEAIHQVCLAVMKVLDHANRDMPTEMAKLKGFVCSEKNEQDREKLKTAILKTYRENFKKRIGNLAAREMETSVKAALNEALDQL